VSNQSTKWFAIYGFGTYELTKETDSILCAIHPNYLKKPFFDIKSGHLVVYYEVGIGRILGICKVLQDDYFIVEKENNKFCAKKIEKIIGFKDEYVDFRKLSKEVNWKKLDIADMNEKMISWKVLDEQDYASIMGAFLDESLVENVNTNCHLNTYGPAGFILNPEVSVGILEYYNSRATSFASLFVASVFGLVTLAAIIQSLFSTSTVTISSNAGLIIITAFLYLIFNFNIKTGSIIEVLNALREF